MEKHSYPKERLTTREQILSRIQVLDKFIAMKEGDKTSEERKMLKYDWDYDKALAERQGWRAELIYNSKYKTK